MRQFYIFPLFIILSCGVKTNVVTYGETTRADLIQFKGHSQREEKVPVADSSVMIYSDKESYQLQRGVVTAGLKAPAGPQRNLLYWKHKLKDCRTLLTKIPSIDGHGPAQLELNCDAQGIKVIYQEGSEVILKVVEYAKK